MPPLPFPSTGTTADFSDHDRAIVADLSRDEGYAVPNIMPFGDSITYGYVNRTNIESGGYRTFLSEHFQSIGIRANFVGSLSTGPSNIDRDHEGHRGWTINQLDAQAAGLCRAADPDALLVMAGHQ